MLKQVNKAWSKPFVKVSGAVEIVCTIVSPSVEMAGDWVLQWRAGVRCNYSLCVCELEMPDDCEDLFKRPDEEVVS